jgi:hypothetical protein
MVAAQRPDSLCVRNLLVSEHIRNASHFKCSAKLVMPSAA